MALRIIQVTLPAERKKTLEQIAERYEAVDIWWDAKNEDGRRTVNLLVNRKSQQDILDSIQNHLQDIDCWRAVLLPVEASIPRDLSKTEDNTQQRKFHWRKSLTREELYEEVVTGANADLLYFLMVLLSTVVAAIGLINDNVAVVIAAMVIAPLLGPNLALAFGTALGDQSLIRKSLITCTAGLAAAIIPCIAVGYFLPNNIESAELYSRTDVNYSAMLLALCSGAAAVLSLTTGVSSALVGVMVSVALLPPAAAFGIFLGMGHQGLAWDSGLLMITNIVCVALSAQAVLFFMGIRPRTFLEKRAATQSSWLHGLISLSLLIFICVIIYHTKNS